MKLEVYHGENLIGNLRFIKNEIKLFMIMEKLEKDLSETYWDFLKNWY